MLWGRGMERGGILTGRREDKGENNRKGDNDTEDGRDTEQQEGKGETAVRDWLSIKVFSITSPLRRLAYLDGNTTLVTEELCWVACVAREGRPEGGGR